MNYKKVLQKFLKGVAIGGGSSIGVTGMTGEIEPTVIAFIAALTGLINAIDNVRKHWGK